MIKFPDPKIENESLYKHALSEINRLWDSGHETPEFLYLLDWISDYEDYHYPIDAPQSDATDDWILFYSEPEGENIEKVQFAIDVGELADFSDLPGVESLSFRVVVNGYKGQKNYYPAEAMKLVSLLERALEFRLKEFIKICGGEG